MKIGIITQPLHTNYGGILQNYALQQVLKRMGHTVTTVRQSNPPKSLLKEWKGWLKYSVFHILYPTRYDKPAIVVSGRETKEIRKNINLFIDSHIDCSPTIGSHEEFSNLKDAGHDAFIVGSDQCWRPKYNKDLLYEMFLSFLPDNSQVKRLAYAVSFGTDQWEMNEEQTRICSGLAKSFSFISVREDSGVRLCKEYLGVGSTQVLDPTLLLDRNDYLSLIKDDSDEIPQNSLLAHILDPCVEIDNFINIAAGKTGLVPFSILPKQPGSFGTFFRMKRHMNEFIFPSPETWLKSIASSGMTIVDSFHGMVFSIIFNKPFWVIGNADRGMSRFTSLLKLFNLEDRLVKIDENRTIDFHKPIDWEQVNRIREDQRTKSLDLLARNINA